MYIEVEQVRSDRLIALGENRAVAAKRRNPGYDVISSFHSSASMTLASRFARSVVGKLFA